MHPGADPDDRPELVRLLDRPPCSAFHAAVAAGLGLWLWAWSVPGLSFSVWVAAVVALGLLGLGWTLRSATFLWARRQGRAIGSAVWFAVAPAAVVLALMLNTFDVPLRVRWTVSKPAFERVLHRAPPRTADKQEWVDFAVPERIGTYRISQAYRVGDAVILYESNGALFDDAGFAHLPTGPFDELNTGWFEAPRFRPLGGHWYAWTASW